MLDLKKKYLSFIKKQEIFGEYFYDKINQLNKFYLPLCNELFKKYRLKKKPLIVGLSGGQGSGKSTISKILQIILEVKFKLNVVCFSIDDFYKTASERKKMSKSIHSLFRTRGVPGTHDYKMLTNVFNYLTRKKFKTIRIPKFDKAIDDRSKVRYWQTIKKKPDIIIFEGWCVGARPQSIKELKKPLNSLEKEEDTNLTWRKKVNNELRTNYKKIYKLLDKKIYLKVPSFGYVLKWRLLQEKKLRMKLNKKKSMNNKEVKRFVMFYERITRKMVKDYKNNDVIMFIDKKHKIGSIKF